MINRIRYVFFGMMAVLGLMLGGRISHAADTVRVSADASGMEALSDDRYLIPVMLYHNKGLMGFRISLEYDREQLRIVSLSKGVITSKGNFMTDIDRDAPGGRADVIWNNTSEIKAETGSLFYITVETDADAIKMNLTFRQEDTFNEKYQDVRFNCESIKIDVRKTSALQTSREGDNASQADAGNTKESEDDKEKADSNASQTDAGNTKGSKDGKENVGSNQEADRHQTDGVGQSQSGKTADQNAAKSDRFDNHFVAKSRGGSDADSKENVPDTVITEKEAKENAIKEQENQSALSELSGNVDAVRKKIQKAVISQLKKDGNQTIEDIPAEKKEEFVQRIKEELSSEGIEVETDVLQDEIKKISISGSTKTGQHKNPVIFIMAGLLVVLVMISIRVVWIRRKNKNVEDSNEKI